MQQKSSQFTATLIGTKFSCDVRPLVDWLTAVSAADLTYHRVRQEKWKEFVSIVSYSVPQKIVTITPKQFAAVKQVLTARKNEELAQEALLLFDVVLAEMWDQIDMHHEQIITGAIDLSTIPTTQRAAQDFLRYQEYAKMAEAELKLLSDKVLILDEQNRRLRQQNEELRQLTFRVTDAAGAFRQQQKEHETLMSLANLAVGQEKEGKEEEEKEQSLTQRSVEGQPPSKPEFNPPR